MTPIIHNIVTVFTWKVNEIWDRNIHGHQLYSLCVIDDVYNWYGFIWILGLYQRVSSGSCASSGRRLASTKYQCELVAKELGLSGIIAKAIAENDYPPGCIYRFSDNDLVWNDFVWTNQYLTPHCGSDLGTFGVYDCLCINGKCLPINFIVCKIVDYYQNYW